MSEIKRDYSFYKFIHSCNEIKEFCYVGSTSNVKCRKSEHKSRCNNPDSPKYNTKLYQVMRDNGGFENFKMVILGTRENLTKTEAHMVEEEYRKSENANLNDRRCFLSPEVKKQYNKEYSEAHREESAEYNKKWYEANKDEKAEYNKKWYEAHKDEKAEYNRKWNEAHKDEKAEYNRKWREAKKQAAKNI